MVCCIFWFCSFDLSCFSLLLLLQRHKRQKKKNDRPDKRIKTTDACWCVDATKIVGPWRVYPPFTFLSTILPLKRSLKRGLLGKPSNLIFTPFLRFSSFLLVLFYFPIFRLDGFLFFSSVLLYSLKSHFFYWLANCSARPSVNKARYTVIRGWQFQPEQRHSRAQRKKKRQGMCGTQERNNQNWRHQFLD